MTSTLPAELDEAGPEAYRSRLLQSCAERERLERVLLMLPTALSEFTPQHAVEVFSQAALEMTSARFALVVMPELLKEPAVYGLQPVSFNPATDFSRVPALRPAFSGRVVYIPDTRRVFLAPERSVFGQAAGGGTFRSLMALPIRGRDARVVGVLCLAHHRTRAFSERQVALAGALAAHLGHTIEVTDAVTEQTRISTALQKSLLPPLLPTIPGLDVAARYRPSGLGNLVGGDFYDLFPTGTGAWNLLLGDSSGIGPEAAGLAGIVRYTARALAESELSPADMLRNLNRAVLRATSDGRFCTAVLAQFTMDEAGVSVSLASAGHPPVYLQRAGGVVEPAVQATGTILGFVEDARVGETSLVLSPGDALVFYTDGVIEARDASGELFGEDRLVKVLSEAAGRSAEGTARRIELDVLDHRGALNTDDVAIVVARVPAPGQPRD